MVEIKSIKPKGNFKKQVDGLLTKQINKINEGRSKINDRLLKIKCPDHDLTPKKIEYSPDGEIKYIEACCEKLEELVKAECAKALKAGA